MKLKYWLTALLIGAGLTVAVSTSAQVTSPNFWKLSGTTLSSIGQWFLKLTSKTDPDPTEVDGMIYYNTTSNAFRCGVSGVWVNCDTTGGSGGGSISGGIGGYVTRYTASSTITTGKLLDNGTVAGMNATSSTVTFNIQGNAGTANPFLISSSTGTALLTVAPNGSTTIASLTNALPVRSTAGGALYNGAIVLGGSDVSGLLPSANGGVASTTADYWIDGNRTDTYTSDGTISRPYKTFATAITKINADAFTSANLYITPATYVEGPPLTFPNENLTVHGNNATLVVPSGVTVAGSYDIYDLNVIGTVSLTDTSYTSIHQWNNGYLSGTTTISGLVNFVSMATGTGSPITVLQGGQLNITASLITNRIVNYGSLNADFNSMLITDNTNPVIDSSTTTTGSFFTLLGNTIQNRGTGGGINCANGATSTPNEINAVIVLVSGTNDISCGTAVTAVNNYNAINTNNGATLFGTGSALIGTYFAGLTVQGSGSNVPFTINSSTGTTILKVTNADMVSINSSTPVASLTVQGTATYPTRDIFRVASSSNTTVLTVDANGLTTLNGLKVTSATTTFNGVSYFWPSALPASNKVLQSDSAGTLTWVADQTGAGGSLSGGTTGYVATWASSTGLTIGTLRDNGTVSGVNATSSTVSFNVQGAAGTNDIFNAASSSTTSVLKVTAGSQVLIATGARFTIPQGTGPTLSAVGDLAFDTTSGQLQVHDGTAGRAIPLFETKSFTISSSTWNALGKTFPLEIVSATSTFTAIKCFVTAGTTAVFNFTDGSNAMDSITCATTATNDDGSIANAQVQTNDKLQGVIGTVTGQVDYLTVTVKRRVDAD